MTEKSTRIVPEPAVASLCEQCGECVEACPQSLPIPEQLEAVAAQFEGRWFRPTVWLAKRIFAFKRWKDLRQVKKS